MALSNETLLQMRDDLQTAIYSGARSVTHDGKTVQYGSLREMLQALSRLETQISGVRATSIQYLAMSSGDAPRDSRCR